MESMKQRTKFVPESELKDDVIDIGKWKESNRASGTALCRCGKPLDEHYQPVKKTCPTIVKDCDGNWWKL